MANPKKLAVLGGGVGSLSTLAAIVTNPNYKPEEWDITVYQEGWRLGGKGASGRNQAVANRIEEHGLHIWLGFYDNAFHLIQAAYEAMGCDWRDFFTPASLVVFQEEIQGQWIPWPINFPQNSEQPGTPSLFLKPQSYLEMGLDVVIDLIADLFENPEQEAEVNQALAAAAAVTLKNAEWLKGLGTLVQKMVEGLLKDLANLLLKDGVKGFLRLMQKILKEGAKLGESLFLEVLEVVARMARFLLTVLGQALRVDLNKNTALRRFWTLVDLSLTILIGMIEDQVLTKGFESIDEYDFREWLTKHGATHWATDNPLLQAIYDLIFAYEQGDINRPRLSAGVALYGCIRMLMTYKGSIFWKMNMSMGDIIFTPLHSLLSQKGVKFEFFQKVTNLQYDPQTSAITAIELQKQVNLAPGVKAYQPYIQCRDPRLPKEQQMWNCWPSSPLWEQLNPQEVVELKELETQNLTLESAWSPWPGVGNRTLKLGQEFDLVLCGISKRPLAEISQSLRMIPAFAEMMDSVQTVTTMAGQFWFNRYDQELGYNPGQKSLVGLPAINGGFAEPYGTVADLSELIEKENWPPENQPKYLAYVCGPMPMPVPPVNFSDTSYPQRALDQVRAEGWRWLEQFGPRLWPKTTFSAKDQDCPQLSSQYWRSGQNLTEHYVLSIPGTTASRIGAHDLGVKNLFFAGDWTKNVINAGCVEGGCISGLMCARALTGWEIPIFGV